jgi:hypothetical protein
MSNEPFYLLDFRFSRDIEKLHFFGPRPIKEIFVELGCDFIIRNRIESLVRRSLEAQRKARSAGVRRERARR